MLKYLSFLTLLFGLVFTFSPSPFAQDTTQHAFFFGGYRVVEGGHGTATVGGIIPNGLTSSTALTRLHTLVYSDIGEVEMAAAEEAMLFPISPVFTVGFFGGGTFWLDDQTNVEMTDEEKTIWYLMGSTGGFGSAKFNEKIGIWAAVKWLAPITEDQPDGQWMFGVGASIKL